MHKHFFKFTQDDPDSTWFIDDLPTGADGAVITHIETPDGIILQPEDQRRMNGGIQLVFGVQQVEGTAYGEYLVDDLTDEPITSHDHHTIETDGSIVNITINQHAKVQESQ